MGKKAIDQGGDGGTMLEEWLELGKRLGVAGPEKFRDTVVRMREVVEAQEIIARYDHQLFFRGRPRKRYLA